MPPSLRMAATCGLLSLLLLPTGAATARDATPAEVIAELTTAYAKQGGYIATYHSEGEGKSLGCTLGSDLTTGLGVTHLTAVKGDQKMEDRMWSTSNDRVFVESNGKLFVMKGMNEEWKSLRDLWAVLTEPSEPAGIMSYIPGMLLGKTSISPSLSGSTTASPPWKDAAEAAAIQASDEATVTFLTKEHGLLTISRENGMLIRQSLAGENGEARILEIKDFQPNPGKETIEKLSSDWTTDSAEEKPVVAWMAPLRLMAFQKIIDFAEQGQVDKDKLEARLEEQYAALQHFAKACINESEGPFASKADWPGALGKVKTAAWDKWRQDEPGAVLTDQKAFLENLQKAEVRLALRNSIVAGLLELEKTPEMVMDDIFGRGGWASLKVGNDLGIAAKKSLVNALAKAYLEALVDLKMTRQWDQRDGLD